MGTKSADRSEFVLSQYFLKKYLKRKPFFIQFVEMLRIVTFSKVLEISKENCFAGVSIKKYLH